MLLLGLVIIVPSCGGGGGGGGSSASSAPKVTLVSGSTQKVLQAVGETDFETGAPTLSQTITQCRMYGTDGGSTFEWNGKHWAFFGDSDHDPTLTVPFSMININSMAVITSTQPELLTLDFLKDTARIPGETVWKAPVLLDAVGNPMNLQGFNTQLDGLGDGTDLYVLWSQDFMARSVLSKTTDPATVFNWVYDLGSTHFINVDIVKRNGITVPGLESYGQTDWIFFFGSGTVANKHVYLAATPLARLRAGDRSAVHFLSSYSWGAPPTWSLSEGDSKALFNIQGNGYDLSMFGGSPWGSTEPNVFYEPTLSLWIAMYADNFVIEVRAARNPWGPWGNPAAVFDRFTDYGAGKAYGRFIHDDRPGGYVLQPGDCPGGTHHPSCDKAHNPGEEDRDGVVYGAWVIEKYTVVSNAQVTLYFFISSDNPYVVVLLKTKVTITS